MRRPRKGPGRDPGYGPGRGTGLLAGGRVPGRARKEGGRYRPPAGAIKALLLFLLPLLFLFWSVPTGFLLEGPGPSFDLQSGITVQGAGTYGARGELMLTSVSLREARLFNHLAHLFGDERYMLKAREYLGEGLDVEGQNRVDEAVTLLSRNSAAVVGLRKMGLEVEVEELGVLVVAVAAGYPAEGKLAVGEVVVSVNGAAVRNAVELGKLIDAAPHGEEVILGVRKMDEEELHAAWEEGGKTGISALLGLSNLLGEERKVALAPVWEPRLGRWVIGASTRDYFDYESEVEVEWRLEAVKGPSAGLMLALSLVNALTPEDITRGRKVAGTGEIFPDGSVGPVGGLPMKIRAAEAGGAEVFLYPAANEDDLAGVETSLRLIPVESLEDALLALEGLQ